MPFMPCPILIPCPPDQPGTNYSSEDTDDFDYVVTTHVVNPPPLNSHWTADGCVRQCTSIVSQAEADLCALAQATQCVNTFSDGGGTTSFFSAGASCTIPCPDGGTFTQTVPSGLFIAASQAEADAMAYSYACNLAYQQRFCLGDLPRCCCAGVPLTCHLLTVDFATAQIVFSASGLPFGMTLTTNKDCSNVTTLATARFEGTPVVAGNYSFSITGVNAAFGSSSTKTYFFSVIEIATLALPNFTIGVPYSFQLTVTGGTGPFVFQITAGALPSGLTMTPAGLISGTPTSGGDQTLTFDVVDTFCQQADDSFFPPAVSLSTRSTTRIATVIGYPEFSPISTPPKKYHNLTWSGWSEQWAYAAGTSTLVAHARYEWFGTGSIDTTGAQTSNYTKNLFCWCPTQTNWPVADHPLGLSVGGRPVVPAKIIGYCFSGDPNTCLTCTDPPDFSRDVQTNYIGDSSDFIDAFWRTGGDSTHFDRVNGPTHSFTDACTVHGAIGFSSFNGFLGIFGPWVDMVSANDYHAVLDTEYTDAEALANAAIIHGNGNTAATFLRTLGFTNQFTAVNYTVHCTALVVGRNYIATVQIYNTATGAITIKSYPFTAAAMTNDIIDNVPTPVAGQPLQVRHPTIAYAP